MYLQPLETVFFKEMGALDRTLHGKRSSKTPLR